MLHHATPTLTRLVEARRRPGRGLPLPIPLSAVVIVCGRSANGDPLPVTAAYRHSHTFSSNAMRYSDPSVLFLRTVANPPTWPRPSSTQRTRVETQILHPEMQLLEVAVL